jgi:hypothetical protein
MDAHREREIDRDAEHRAEVTARAIADECAATLPLDQQVRLAAEVERALVAAYEHGRYCGSRP